MSKFFNDVGKDARDFISDDFPSDGTVKFTTQSKTPDGVTAKATVRRYLKAGREQIDAVIEPKYEWKEKNVELSGKFATANDFTASAIVKDLVKGSKIEVSGTSNEKTASSKLVLSQKQDPVAAKITVTVPLDLSPTIKKTPTKLVGDVVIEYPKDLHVGGNVSLDLNEKMGVKVDGVVGYSQNDWQITGRGSYSPPTREGSVIFFGASFFHNVSKTIRWALDIETDQAFKRGPIGVVAGEYKIDDYTTLKGKATIKIPDPSKPKPEARVAVVAKQKINPNLSVTLGADINVRNIISGDAADGLHSFGVEIKLQE